ncbi:MAG TPA: ankyrin repeat domain-containing protein, partial [Candidatus Kapabacteria bacterium]|nr:ankyrin repeat domain-containing protein [Candidatus Kapabacteria bacterium]
MSACVLFLQAHLLHSQATSSLVNAVTTGNAVLVQSLLQSHAGSIDQKDSTGDTPLMLAARKSHASIVDMLLAAGADVNAQNNDGETPLHAACIGGDTAIVLEI